MYHINQQYFPYLLIHNALSVSLFFNFRSIFSFLRMLICVKPFTYTSFYISFVLDVLFVTSSMKVTNKSFRNVETLR